MSVDRSCLQPALYVVGDVTPLREEVEQALLGRFGEVQICSFQDYGCAKPSQPIQVLIAVGYQLNDMLSESLSTKDAFPVMLVLAEDASDQIKTAFSLGCDEVICAPFSAQELLARIEQMLKRWELEKTQSQVIDKLRDRSEHDALTQLLNRYGLEQHTKREISAAARNGSSVSLLMLDLDNYKTINDTYGHPAGDQVLRHMAELLTNKLRSYDLVARYGGDEFVVVLPHTDGGKAEIVAKKLIAALNEHQFIVAEDTVAVTASIGIATVEPIANALPDDEEFGRLLAMADQALYQAKKTAGNSCAVGKPIGAG